MGEIMNGQCRLFTPFFPYLRQFVSDGLTVSYRTVMILFSRTLLTVLMTQDFNAYYIRRHFDGYKDNKENNK